MKNKLKASSLFLAALMLVSAAGCSSNSATTQDTAADTSAAGASTTGEVQKPEKIVAMLDIFDMTEENGKQKVLDKYKELTGVTLEVNQPPHNQYYEKVNLAFASGDLPDVVELAPSDNSSFVTYATQDALYDMTADVDNSEALKKANKTIVDGVRLDGKLYGFPTDSGNGTVTMVRKDWLDKTGTPMPTNYDEYLNMLRAFTFNDPDGNGQQDTKGFTAAGLDAISDSYRYFLDFMQDAVPAFEYKDGKWVDGFQEPEMVQALERITAAYKEGLIDQDIVTNKTSTAREKIINGEVGTMSYWAGLWNRTLDNKTKAVNPNAEIVSLPAIKEVTYINRVPSVYSITAACENPEGVFKNFIEFIHDGKEGQNLFTYGVEGLTYEIKDGVGTMLPTLADPKTTYKKIVFSPAVAITPLEKDIFPMDELVKESSDIFQAKMVQAIIPALTETYVKMNADITQARSTVFSKILLGEYSIEDGLAAYKEKVNGELQMEKVLQEMNAK